MGEKMVNKSMEYLLSEVEKYGFECEAGRLKNCTGWQMLKKQAMKLEKYTEVFKEIVRSDNNVVINIEETPKEIKAKILAVWENIFKDFPDDYGVENEG